MKYFYLLASILIVFECASTNPNKLFGTIPNEDKAIEITKEILLKTYLKKEINNLKFTVSSGFCASTDSWIVKRIATENIRGGDVYLEITKNRGKICKFELGE